MYGFWLKLRNRGPWSIADGTAAAEALWQLHTTLCRCMHSTAAGIWAPPDVLEKLPITSCMTCVLLVAACLSSTLQERSAEASSGGEAPSRCGDGSRHVLAMSVAQAKTELMAASCPALANDGVVAPALFKAINVGPLALGSSPPVQQVLEGLAERLGGNADEGANPADSLQNHVSAVLRREPQPGDALELAQVAATRSCAYLRCANLGGEGGPAAGRGAGSQLCSKRLVAWYCGTACSHADWRAGHRRVCRALGAARVANQQE